MKLRTIRLMCRFCAVIPGAILFGGCLMNVQNNLDVLFSPGALSNRMIAPFVAVLPLVELLARASHGFNG